MANRGRPKGTFYIETPERLLELFEGYKKHVKENPRTKIEYVGRDGERVVTPLATPLLIEGFAVYCMDHTRITYPDLTEYLDGKNEAYRIFFHIAARIRQEIRADQLGGGMVGQYNSSLTAKLNHLVEKTQTENTNHNINVLNVDPLSDPLDISEMD